MINAKIIERDTIPRYSATLNTVLPSVGAIWYDPSMKYTLRLSTGVRAGDRAEEIKKGKANVIWQGYEVKVEIDQKKNAKGMHEFKITCAKAEKQLTSLSDKATIGTVSQQRDSLGANSDLAKNANKSKEA